MPEGLGKLTMSDRTVSNPFGANSWRTAGLSSRASACSSLTRWSQKRGGSTTGCTHAHQLGRSGGRMQKSVKSELGPPSGTPQGSLQRTLRPTWMSIPRIRPPFSTGPSSWHATCAGHTMRRSKKYQVCIHIMRLVVPLSCVHASCPPSSCPACLHPLLHLPP